MFKTAFMFQVKPKPAYLFSTFQRYYAFKTKEIPGMFYLVLQNKH